MATHRRRSTSKRRRRNPPMKSVRRRSGAKVSRAAWHRSSFRRNPRRRRHYRRNPAGILGTNFLPITNGGTGTVAYLEFAGPVGSDVTIQVVGWELSWPE